MRRGRSGEGGADGRAVHDVGHEFSPWPDIVSEPFGSASFSPLAAPAAQAQTKPTEMPPIDGLRIAF
jgi:hypothetical protein